MFIHLEQAVHRCKSLISLLWDQPSVDLQGRHLTTSIRPGSLCSALKWSWTPEPGVSRHPGLSAPWGLGSSSSTSSPTKSSLLSPNFQRLWNTEQGGGSFPRVRGRCQGFKVSAVGHTHLGSGPSLLPKSPWTVGKLLSFSEPVFVVCHQG